MNKKLSISIIGLLIIAVGLGFIMYHGLIFKLSNPELTQTQVLIEKYPKYIIGVVFMVFGQLIVGLSETYTFK